MVSMKNFLMNFGGGIVMDTAAEPCPFIGDTSTSTSCHFTVGYTRENACPACGLWGASNADRN